MTLALSLTGSRTRRLEEVPFCISTSSTPLTRRSLVLAGECDTPLHRSVRTPLGASQALSVWDREKTELYEHIGVLGCEMKRHARYSAEQERALARKEHVIQLLLHRLARYEQAERARGSFAIYASAF